MNTVEEDSCTAPLVPLQLKFLIQMHSVEMGVFCLKTVNIV